MKRRKPSYSVARRGAIFAYRDSTGRRRAFRYAWTLLLDGIYEVLSAAENLDRPRWVESNAAAVTSQ